MSIFDRFKKEKPGTSTITLELEIKNLKDLEKVERLMEKLTVHLERAAGASDRLLWMGKLMSENSRVSPPFDPDYLKGDCWPETEA